MSLNRSISLSAILSIEGTTRSRPFYFYFAISFSIPIGSIFSGETISRGILFAICKRQVSCMYGFHEEVTKKYGNSNVWKYCNELFDYLPLGAIIDGKLSELRRLNILCPWRIVAGHPCT